MIKINFNIDILEFLFFNQLTLKNHIQFLSRKEIFLNRKLYSLKYICKELKEIKVCNKFI